MIEVGNLKIDIDRLEVRVYEKVVKLSAEEMEVLKYLAMQPGEVISREFLLAKLYRTYGDIRIVDVTVRRIREKIEKDTSNPQILKTKRGIGYYLNDNIENDMKNNLKTNKKDNKTVFDYNMQKTLKDRGFSQEECERLQKQVLYIANKFINTKAEIDDLISIGNIGIMKAINRFDAHYNIDFETYASRKIENEILMFLNRGKEKEEISIDKSVEQDGIDKQLIKASIDKLNSRERNLMELRFGFISGKEKSQKEIANMYGISQSYVSRLERKVIKKIKNESKHNSIMFEIE